ncbi:MAG: adenylyltransferase/cytidyltransferase family protein, partial [Planctomycetota bacterium]
MDSGTRTRAKILTRDELLARRRQAGDAGLTVVQCHGCFDIVHPGHVRHLQFAAQQGERLLVSITPDEGVNKGDGRPLFSEDLRAENLAALDCVDWVYINDGPTAEGLLAESRPDVYIKGREYESNDDPRFLAERAIIESHGGRVVFSSGDVVFSSTALVEALGAGRAGQAEHERDPLTARLQPLGSTHDLSYPTLAKRVASFAGMRVAVFGEAVLDTYVHCDRPEVGTESPVLSLRPVSERTFDGGAAVVASHLAALGARPTLVTALPETLQGEAFRDRMARAGVEVEAVGTSTPMLEKRRFLVGRDKVMKLDRPGTPARRPGSAARGATRRTGS